MPPGSTAALRRHQHRAPHRGPRLQAPSPLQDGCGSGRAPTRPRSLSPSCRWQRSCTELGSRTPSSGAQRSGKSKFLRARKETWSSAAPALHHQQHEGCTESSTGRKPHGWVWGAASGAQGFLPGPRTGADISKAFSVAFN